SIFFLLVAFFNGCLSFLSLKYLLKPALILLLFVASFAAYFMKTYGVMIDQSMVKTVLTSDLGNISELLSVKMLYYFMGLGLLPSLFVLRTKIRRKGFMTELFMVSGTVLLSLVCVVVILVFFYKDYISLGKNYNYVRHLINPVSSLYVAASIARKS
ncbi:MAG: DUF1705 domain-containing protein, partial [Rhodoferax sp.]|nr:DUF1705 domain-containing protein [Rhodoferax sp.]